jgi:glucose-6-phosphate isomerase
MFTSSIKLKSFYQTRYEKKIKKNLKSLLSSQNQILKSLSKDYSNKYNIKNLKKIVGNSDIKLIGMGGSSLGAKAIYNFLEDKVKKKFLFVDNLSTNLKLNKKKTTNLVISKSGNTLETISNANILIKNEDRNIFITENKPSYLLNLAQKLKAEVIYHNDFIGGRYSVLSEVGMLPAELMGFNIKKFKQLNNLVKNKNFLNLLIKNTGSILNLVMKKKFNSIILNYDEKADSFFKWYQQLIAESLGKKKNGILPIISTMPKDNHSLMQFYLDGSNNNFFTFFYCKEKNSKTLNNKKLLNSHKYLGSSSIGNIIYKQKIATENIFKKKSIPYRSFELNLRNEKTIGELFCFFILETILLGRALKVNPFNQPSVELIKKETRKQFS